MDLVKEFSQHLQSALERMTGQAPQLSSRPLESPLDPSAPVFWWEQPLDLAPSAIVWVGATRDVWSGAGGYDRHSTYLEVLQQALGALASAIGLAIGRPVSCQGGAEASLPPSDAPAEVTFRFDGQPPRSVWVAFSPGLTAVLSPGSPAERSAPPPETADPAADGASNKLDLLLDVELPVSISFGRTHVPLKDVLNLTSGSIVELNRGVTEPVEVIVNNCVIARGEVVVVEGNYGVKINQIVSRRERLRSLP